MLYSEATRVAFLHIHKTGGQSVMRTLRDTIPDIDDLAELPEAHYSLREFFDVMSARGVDPSSTTVAAVICHPVAHAVSIYEYWRSDRIPEADRLLPTVAAARRLDFAGFLDEVLVDDQFAQQLLVDGEVPPNVVLMRRERLGSDTNALLRQVLGRRVRVEMPRINATRHAPASDYLTAETLPLITRDYAWTFAQGWYDPEVIPDDEAPVGGLRRLVASVRRAPR